VQQHQRQLPLIYPLLFHILYWQSAVSLRAQLTCCYTAAVVACPAGPERQAQFQQQLVAAIEASVRVASADVASDAAGTAPAQEQTAAMVTGVAAFPGCWQLVMHLVLPDSQPSSSQLQQLHQQVQQAAQHVLAANSDDRQLLSTQLQAIPTNYMTAV
jgi:hypothetical protein